MCDYLINQIMSLTSKDFKFNINSKNKSGVAQLFFTITELCSDDISSDVFKVCDIFIKTKKEFVLKNVAPTSALPDIERDDEILFVLKLAIMDKLSPTIFY